jgi:D-alanyl-D-alanine carboxypeptidase (penicillin-binding protein 5/6)
VRRPIASVTKVMTALVVLERTNLRDVVKVSADAVFSPNDRGVGSTLGLRAGERLTVRDVLYGALLGSANDAARALAIHVAGDEPSFVELMNEHARALGMRDTRFASATGLDDRGHSTADDLLILARAAANMPASAQIMRTRSRAIPGPGARDRRIQNRNVLLWLYPGATGMKTGFTPGAGYCLIGTAERDGRHLVAIVLRAPNEAFSDAAALLDYGFEAFARMTLVTAGEALGRVRIDGGSVPVVAGDSLESLVPTLDVGAIRFRREVDPRTAYPPTAGEVVGTYRAVIGGLDVGSVPMVVAQVPDPPDPGEAPWWIRAGSAVAGAIGSAIGSLF